MTAVNLSTVTRTSQSGGVQGNGASGSTSLSDSGRYVVFTSDSSNLVTSDTNSVTDVFWRDTNLTPATSDDTIARINLDASGAEANSSSSSPFISGDGRYVVFVSSASNLVASDTNSATDVFWRDTNLTAATSDDAIVRLSVSAGGAEGNDGSAFSAISGTGRYVAFRSLASNLVSGDTNSAADVFWRDTNLTATTSDDTIARISISADGAQSGATSTTFVSMSGNGRYVLFQASAALVSDDTNGHPDTYWRDTNLTAATSDDTIARISIALNGTEGNNESFAPRDTAMSADGRYVVFTSLASNLVSGDTNGSEDIFWRDTNLTATTSDDAMARISVAHDGAQANALSQFPVISDDGRYVLFQSGASNLVLGDTNGVSDVFLVDTRLTATTADDSILRLSVNPSNADANGASGPGAISGDGQVAVFSSSANNVVAGDSNGVTDSFALALGGTPGNDSLVGSSGADSISSSGGTDTVSGGTGGDYISAGAGGDTLYGGQGADFILGDPDADILYGDNDNDLLFGDDGADTIYGGMGSDTIVTSNSSDTGNDVAYGDDGDDVVFGGPGADTIRGGDGNDALVGNGGADVLIGGAGNDSLWGDGGADIFTFSSGGGSDIVVDFQSGTDFIDVASFSFANFAAFQSAVQVTVFSNAIMISGGGITLTIIGTTAFTQSDYILV